VYKTFLNNSGMRRLTGSDLNLTCTCLTTPEPPVAVVWLHVSDLTRFIYTLLRK
jgi:hypothetical protein